MVALSAPRQRCQAGNMAAPRLRFLMGYAMLEECPFRTEDEEASKLTLLSTGAVSQVVGSGGGDVSLGGHPGICVIMFREAERPLERRRGARGCYLLADTTG